MKTRIIQTRVWKDEKIHKLSLEAQHLFIYLLTCESINLCGIFELPDDYMALDTKIPTDKLEQAKMDLQRSGRVVFCGGWVRVVNAEKWNKYRKSSDTEKAYFKEIGTVPKDVLEKLSNSTVESTVESTTHSYHNTKTKIQNTKNIIQKPKTKNQKEPDLRINECISFFEEQVGMKLDGSQAENRRFCYLLLQKMEKSKPGNKSVEVVKALIAAGIADSWHGKNMSSFKYLYYNAGKIILSRKKQINSAVRL